MLGKETFCWLRRKLLTTGLIKNTTMFILMLTLWALSWIAQRNLALTLFHPLNKQSSKLLKLSSQNQSVDTNSNRLIDIPSEALIPTSPLYGMMFMNAYGLPLSEKMLFQNEWQDWRDYFPDLVFNIKRQQELNPDQDPSLFTHSALLTLPKKSFSFGDQFEATLTSVDSKGRAKKIGGDYYRARLLMQHNNSNGRKYADGIPCRVIDNNNGTYTLKAPLALQGSLKLHVKLVHTLEAIMEIIRQTDGLATWGLQYQAKLQTNEIVTCNMNLSSFRKSKNASYCDYSNPRNGATWYCTLPTSKRCTKIVNQIYGTFEQKGSALTTSVHYDDICLKYGCLKTINKDVIIFVNLDSNKLSQFHLSSFKNENLQSSLKHYVTGYFRSGLWKSFLSSHTLHSVLSLRKCLNGKSVFFLGDSTTRQFFFLLANWFHFYVKDNGNLATWHYPKIAYEKSKRVNDNTTLYYRAHGPPLFNFGPPATRPYISDSIIGLPIGGKNVCVVFNIGTHFFHFHPNIYIHRLKGIKNAILEHHKKFPETTFILKGLNVVDSTKEWVIYRYEILLRNIFQNLKNVIIENLWDLTTVWPLYKYHPDDTVLIKEAQSIFSQFCSRI